MLYVTCQSLCIISVTALIDFVSKQSKLDKSVQIGRLIWTSVPMYAIKGLFSHFNNIFSL